MQPRYARAILALPHTAVQILQKHYGLSNKGSLFRRLRDAGLDHASVVLTLLEHKAFDAVEVLLGQPITICPPCLQRMTPNVEPIDERRIIYVAPNPRLPTTPSFHRYRILRPGMTVEQALVRGITRRDIREWTQEGSIVVQSVANVRAMA